MLIGALALAGHAPAAWVDSAHERAAWIPGVRGVQLAVTPEADAAAIARKELDALARTISTHRIAFVRDVELASDANVMLDQLVGEAARAVSLATTAGVGIEWTAVGTNDDPGSDAINAHLRALRARWLADALASRGVSSVRTAADADEEAVQARQRGAFLRMRFDGAAH